MLRGFGSIPCWRIVFFTFRRCTSFYTARVKTGRTRIEHFSSGLPPKPDFTGLPRDVAEGPNPDSCGAAKRNRRGRDAHYWAPPAQNRTCGFPAYGSHLGWVTAKRSLGQGWRMIGFGSQSFTSCVIRAHVIPSFWLRCFSVRRQRLVTWCRNTCSAWALVGTAW